MTKIKCEATIGSTNMTIEKLSSLEKGQIIQTDQFIDECIDIEFGGKLKGKGQIMRKDGSNVFILKGDLDG